MTPLDLFEDEKEKISIRISTVFEKIWGLRLSYILRQKKKVHYYITLAIEYEGRKCLLGMGLDLTDRKKSEEAIKRQMNDSRISSATNDAIFELDFSSGKSWHNKVSHDNLNMHDENLSTEENKLAI
jgi:hypothetical protein